MNSIDPALDKLYKEDREALSELFSAASDPGAYIFSDADTLQRVITAGLITEDRELPAAVRTALHRKFRWTE